MEEITKKAIRPAGVLILGGFNFFVLGLGSFLILASLYFRSGSQAFKALSTEMGKYFGSQPDSGTLKKAILLQMVVSMVFALSGLGLMLGKEAARKTTLYFSLLVVVFTFAAALFNRAVAGQAFAQIIYPGILIVYLTNRNVEGYFKGSQREEKSGD